MYVTYRYQHVTVSLYYLPRRVRSTVPRNKTPATVTKRTFADLLPCYCYAIKTNNRIIRSRDFRLNICISLLLFAMSLLLFVVEMFFLRI